MFKDTWDAVSNAAVGKLKFLKENPIGFFISSILAGFFIGLGVLLSFTIGGLFTDIPIRKTMMGATFGIALSLIIICGAELFTGNNFIMSTALMDKKSKLGNTIKLWIICLLGNWVGSILIAFMFHFSGLHTGATAEIFASASLAKMSGSFSSLFIRAIFCNILVCLAVWSSFRAKNEVAKLIMIWWCLFAFIISGFEHSIANMTILTIGLLNPTNLALTLGGYFWNIIILIIGNMVGGILFVAFPYFIITREKKEL